VQGSYYIGGAIGSTYCNQNCSGDNIYATGTVTGNSRGGLVGQMDNWTFPLTDSFWDSESSGLATTAGSQGTAKSTSGAKQMAAYTTMGFDFETRWAMVDYEGTDYAVLRYFNQATGLPQVMAFSGGDGSS